MSEAAVVPFRPGGVVPAVVCEPDDELIERLESMLVDARSGHLRAVAYVMIDRDRAIATGWAGHGDHHDMTAGVSILQHRYISAGRSDD